MRPPRWQSEGWKGWITITAFNLRELGQIMSYAYNESANAREEIYVHEMGHFWFGNPEDPRVHHCLSGTHEPDHTMTKDCAMLDRTLSNCQAPGGGPEDSYSGFGGETAPHVDDLLFIRKSELLTSPQLAPQ